MTRYAREYTRAEALAHPWWGVECPSCGAEPGEPCKPARGYTTIHGTRTRASTAGYVDPRPLYDPATDCPTCPAPDCGLPCGSTLSLGEIELTAGTLGCCACGHTWRGTAAELAQARRADAEFIAAREAENRDWSVLDALPEHLRALNRRLLSRPSAEVCIVDEQLGLFGEVRP